MIRRTKTYLTQTGFSLVEMAIVLTIVGVLLAGLLPTLSSQVDQQRRNETQKYMSEVRDALLGYAVAKGYLPCPDTNGDGLENRPCKASDTQQFGTLPYQDLGVANKDAYGNALVYGVTKAFADTAPTFNLTTPSVMDVCVTTACVFSTKLANNVVAVIASSGVRATSADETENLNNTNNNFVSHDLVQNGYDDLVIWLSPNTLFNRMVAAGKLP
jgi:prepilin-type N-terminal cleavage/methylation domain-containing protein